MRAKLASFVVLSAATLCALPARAHHGVVAVGTSLREAFSVAFEVENLATQYLELRAAGLEPVVLSDAEVARVIDKFTDYGRIEGT